MVFTYTAVIARSEDFGIVSRTAEVALESGTEVDVRKQRVIVDSGFPISGLLRGPPFASALNSRRSLRMGDGSLHSGAHAHASVLGQGTRSKASPTCTLGRSP